MRLEKKNSVLNPPHFLPQFPGQTLGTPTLFKPVSTTSMPRDYPVLMLSDKCHWAQSGWHRSKMWGTWCCFACSLWSAHGDCHCGSHFPSTRFFPGFCSRAVHMLKRPFLENVLSNALTGWLCQWGWRKPAVSGHSLCRFLHSDSWRDRPCPGNRDYERFTRETK